LAAGCNNAMQIPGGRGEPKSVARPGEISAEDIYAAYPRKVGKQAAIKAIKKAEKQVQDGDHGGWAYLLKQTKAFADAVATWSKDEKQFCPFPATWFNQGRYEDDQAQHIRRGGSTATRSNAF